jgi:hypothetical protein
MVNRVNNRQFHHFMRLQTLWIRRIFALLNTIFSWLTRRFFYTNYVEFYELHEFFYNYFIRVIRKIRFNSCKI